MKRNQFLALALFSALLALASSSELASEAAFYSTESNTLILGERGSRDVLLAKKHVEVGWRFLATVTETLTYAGSGHSRITQVEALDQHTDGNGATPSIVSGGPGYSFVTIKFVSAFNRGIDFVVKIYGTK